jgi:hypothetical protein
LAAGEAEARTGEIIITAIRDQTPARAARARAAISTAPRLQKRCTEVDVRIFAGGGGCTNFWWGVGVGSSVFFGFCVRPRPGAASAEIASWGGAAGCPAIGAGRPDKWAEGTKGGGGGHVTRCGGRMRAL